MSDRVKISTKRPKKRRDFCKRVNIDDDSSNNVEENSSNSVQDKLLLPAESEVDVYVEEVTISSEKFEEILVKDINDAKRLCGYRFMDLDILSAVVKRLNCHINECEGGLVLTENSKNKKELAGELVIGCDCRYNSSFYTSQSFSKQSFDVNERLVYAMRALGQGYNGVKKFTSLMNMPTPMTANNYDKIIGNVTVVAQRPMHNKQCRMYVIILKIKI